MPSSTTHRYLIALGSNVRHPRHGRPQEVLAAALERLGAEGLKIVAAAPAIASDPIGPSIRRYANSAAIVETPLEPPELLALLKRIERGFVERRHLRRSDPHHSPPAVSETRFRPPPRERHRTVLARPRHRPDAPPAPCTLDPPRTAP
jgi:2-amino-4-hydroxy-6-hydroxymethyldihydropteridine diphosphokinase